MVTDEERIEGAKFSGRFRALSENMHISMPYFAQDYSNETSAERHIFNLEIDIYRLKRHFEKSSPVILIQSMFR